MFFFYFLFLFCFLFFCVLFCFVCLFFCVPTFSILLGCQVLQANLTFLIESIFNTFSVLMSQVVGKIYVIHDLQIKFPFHLEVTLTTTNIKLLSQVTEEGECVKDP